jgi:hemolysin III
VAAAGGVAAAGAGTAARSTLRLSGTALAPRWRGRVHFVALLAALPAALALGWREPFAPVLIYAAALVALYAVSAAYHLLPLSAAWRDRMRRSDHAMIYVFTAASLTPFCVRVMGGTLGWVVLSLVWAGAAAGVAIKFFGSRRAFLLGSALYLLLGWIGVLTFPAALRLGPAEFSLMVAMGLLYTAGAGVLFARRPDPVPHIFGYHEVWHCVVVLASACYFVLIWDLPGRLAR